MHRLICGTFLSVALLTVVPMQAQQGLSDDVNNSKKIHLPLGVPNPLGSGVNSQAQPTGNGIFYHGGPVLLGVTNIYYIWYGNWSVDPNALPILQNLASSIGGSPYFATNTTYSDGNLTPVSNAVSFNGSTTDNYSQGTTLNDAGVLKVVSSAITSGRLPKDTNGVYFVLTSPDVKESSGFITSYCGWHGAGTVASSNIKYSFVGDPATQGLRSCAQQTSNSPNGDAAVDGMASVIVHELEEAVTDPDLNAWYDNQGNESADKCAWTFGKTYAAPNGSNANVNLGGRNYLIQQQWVNANGGYCALALRPSITSISPNTGSAGSAVPVTISGSNLTGATLSISGSGVTSSVSSSSATQIAATLTIAASAVSGARNITISTVGGTTSSLPFTVTVGTPGPTLTSLTPSSGSQGASVAVTLSGSGFTSPASVSVSGTGVTVSNVVVVSGTQITASLVIAASAAPGQHTVSITTGAGTSTGIPFTVAAASALPTLASMNPASALRGTSVRVTLTGTNFTPQTGVRLSGIGAATNNSAVVVSSTQITVTFTFSSAAATGPHNVYVVTAAGNSNVLTFDVN